MLPSATALVGAALFIDNERCGPGEAFVATAGVLLLLWLIASAFEILRLPKSRSS